MNRRATFSPMRRSLLTGLALSLSGAGTLFHAVHAEPAAAKATPLPRERIALKEGADRVTVKGRLHGRRQDGHDYVVTVKDGQTLAVELQASQKASTHFNVLPPDGGEALYRGEVEGDPKWEAQLQADGDYTVRVFLDRAAARKGVSSEYELGIAVF